MLDRINIKAKPFIITLVILVLLTIVSALQEVPITFMLVMDVWVVMFVLSILRAAEKPILLCFCISFFVFLLGRQVCFHYLHMEQVYEFLDETNDLTYANIIVSLIGISIGLGIAAWRRQKKKKGLREHKFFLDRGGFDANYRLSCKLVFYFCYIAALISTFLQILFVQRVGYLESYTVEAGGAGIPSIVSYMNRMMPVALGLYLATRPMRKKALLPLTMYGLYGVLTLFTGQRFPFIGVSMFILIYMMIRGRKEKEWKLKKFSIVLIVLALPILILVLTAYDSIRLGQAFTFEGYMDTLLDFFVQQGGSVNVIRRTIYNAEEIKDMPLVSFNGIYSALFENPVSSRVFNITVYSGNSVERAMNTNSLAHRLSYIAYGSGYVAGRGTGSSYIAELLHDFGTVGVFLGSLLYGWLLERIDDISFRHKLGDGIKLSMIYYLLLSPRGSFDTFVSNVFNMFTVIGFVVILGLSLLLQIPSRQDGKK